ncbi:MAG TPA: CooT family nickel-binding protein [Methanomassiliicoccales archaeon]|nr:CooT family nickel-binding protein [Methanomassiliicoccales archaeon]
MCESTAYLMDGGNKVKVLDDVARVTMDGDRATIVSMMGERKVLDRVRVKLIDQTGGSIILETI